MAISGWMNREQQEVIDYLREENRILREKLGRKRIILNESQKRRLATAAAKFGRDLLRQCGTLFSPDTLLRWHRWFVARKYDGTRLDAGWTMRWETAKGPGLELAMAGVPGSDVFWGENRVNAYDPAMHAPTVLVRRKGKSTVLLMAMEPFRDRPAALKAARCVPVFDDQREAADSESLAVEAVTENGPFVFLVNFDGKTKTCQGQPIRKPLILSRGDAGAPGQLRR
jgi:hypothetical protein